MVFWGFGVGLLECYFVEGLNELGGYLGNDCVPSALQQGYSAWDGFGKGETLGGTEDIPASVQATGKPINHMLKNGFNDSLGWDAAGFSVSAGDDGVVIPVVCA
jgi:hypothetical protein